MQWLNFSDALQFGIEVRQFDLAALPDAPRSNIEGDSFGPQISPVKKEIYGLVNATNLSNELAIAYLDDKYFGQVNYDGKLLPRASVLTDKKAFFRKWPIRNYAIRPNSLAVSCPASLCRLQPGLVN